MSANADDGLADDLEAICRRISDSGVLSSQELLTLRGRYGQTTAGEFVQSLLADGKLTAYQWQELREQRGRSLVLGNYVVLDKLGQGGMGMVLKAYHRRMRRTVALKVLAPQVANNGEMVRRFQREVEAAARLTHPNIVTAFDADTADGVVFLVMEYVPGRDLSSHIKANGPLSIDAAVDYVRQTACGLEYAHQNGVIHRDVKPGNLLLTDAGVVKILDMGLARLDGTADNVDANLTTTGAVMGTVDYMSPEQALDTRRADARADIYSLGCTLFTLLTGRPVYPESTVMKRLLAHREAAIPRLSEHLPQPAATVGTRLGEVDAVLQKMLAKQPGERFQTMGDVMTALEAATRGVRLAQPVAARPPVIHAAKSGSASVTSALVQSATVADVNNAVAPTMTFGQNPHEGTLPSLAGLVTERIPYTRSHKPGFKQSKPWFILLGLASLCLIALGLAVFMTPPALPSTATSKASQATTLNSRPVVPPLLLDSAHWPRGPSDTQWQGILPQPMSISGIRRWQVETVSGRSRIAHLAWNPQGTRIAVASHDKRLRIYRWEQQRLELEQIVPDAELTYWTRGGIHWSPDGRWLAWLPPYGESVRSWDVEQQRFGPTVFASINSSFSGWNGDGTVLAIAGQATSGSGVLLWEWPSGRLMRTMLSEGLDPPRTVHWSPDFQYLATGVGDGATRIWHLDGTPGAVIPIRASQIRWHPTQPLLAVLGRDDAHPSRQFAATVSLDGTIQKMIEERHPHGLGMSLEWSADGRFLISNLGGQNSQFEAYDLNGDFVQDLKYPVGQGWGIAHPLRPEFLLAEVGIQQINLETGESIAHLGRTPVGCPPVWTPDGRYLASASVPGLLDVWDVDRRLHVTSVLPCLTEFSQLQLSDRGEFLSQVMMSGAFDGKRYSLATWSRDGRRLALIQGGQQHAQTMSDAGWSNRGRERLAIADEQLIAIDPNNPATVAPVKVAISSEHKLRGVFTSAEGSEILLTSDAGTNDTLRKLWLLRTSSQITPTEVPMERGNRAVFAQWNRQGDRFAIAVMNDQTQTGQLEIWEPSRPSRLASSRPDALGSHICFSPNGKQLVYAVSDRLLTLATSTAEALHHWQTEAPQYSVSAAWGSDNLSIVATSLPNALEFARIPPVQGDKELAFSQPRFVEWSRDGSLVAAVSHDGLLRVWDHLHQDAPAWTAVNLGDDEWASFTPGGELLHSSGDALSKLFAVLEHADGHFETLPYAVFRDRYQP